jgi:uncharacterized protein YjbJ (UPF0337 family)
VTESYRSLAYRGATKPREAPKSRGERSRARHGTNTGKATLTQQQHPMEAGVDWNRVEGNWKQVTGKIKEKWGKLTDDDLANINGKREQLEGKIQERYGIARDQVRKDVDTWYTAQKW